MIELEKKDCYVAFLDILGFKEYVEKTEADMVLEMFLSIKDIRKKLSKSDIAFGRDIEKYELLHSKLYFYIMSDSIILAIEKSIDGAYAFLLQCCEEIQRKLLFDHNLLIRGGVSSGEFYGVDDINFGKGLIKAYNLELEARYPRIIIDPEIYNNLPKKTVRFLFYRLSEPDGIDDKYSHILYLSEDDGEKLIYDIKKVIDKGFKNAEEEKDERIRNSIKDKYEWLEKYVNEMIEAYYSSREFS